MKLSHLFAASLAGKLAMAAALVSSNEQTQLSQSTTSFQSLQPRVTTVTVTFSNTKPDRNKTRTIKVQRPHRPQNTALGGKGKRKYKGKGKVGGARPADKASPEVKSGQNNDTSSVTVSLISLEYHTLESREPQIITGDEQPYPYPSEPSRRPARNFQPRHTRHAHGRIQRDISTPTPNATPTPPPLPTSPSTTTTSCTVTTKSNNNGPYTETICMYGTWPALEPVVWEPQPGYRLTEHWRSHGTTFSVYYPPDDFSGPPHWYTMPWATRWTQERPYGRYGAGGIYFTPVVEHAKSKFGSKSSSSTQTQPSPVLETHLPLSLAQTQGLGFAPDAGASDERDEELDWDDELERDDQVENEEGEEDDEEEEEDGEEVVLVEEEEEELDDEV